MQISLIPKVSLFLIVSLNAMAQEHKTTIVFVCEHGGARSTIASFYFNRMAKERNLPYQSVFRGLNPEMIPKETDRGLRLDGFALHNMWWPTKLTEEDIKENSLLISLDCSPPSSFEVYQQWKGIPDISKDYAVARNEIVRLLNQLIQDLKTKNDTQH